MDPPTVYVTRPLPPPGTEPLRAAGLTVLQHEPDSPPSRSELRAGVADADALLCLLTELVDDELLASSRRLRVVANLAVGYDNVDVAAAAHHGVVVTDAPDVLPEATADLAWAAMLAACRHVVPGDRLVRSGRWEGWSPTQLVGWPVHGRTLGIVGLGKIGAAVARRAAGFSMRVLYHSRSHQAGEQLGARWSPLDVLLAESDVVSLHAPLTTSTHHLIDHAALVRMKRSAVLVNTARGPLVDEAALVAALRGGVIGAAALDVYEWEPAVSGGLADLDNVVLLPHLGSATDEARRGMVELACANVVAVLAGRPPLTPVAVPRAAR